MAALTDEEIKAICENEIEQSDALSGDLAAERTRAMDRYLGEAYGDEDPGRSGVVTREVLDTVEWVLPQLIRTFTDVDSAVVFDAVGPEDEDAAEQETDAVNHIFWERNKGYLCTYSWFKDALLSKNGVLKVYWDDSETEERAEYEGLTDEQLGELIFDQSVEREVLEYEQDEGGHNIVFKVTKPGRICVENCPPEEFGVNSDMRTCDVQEARFVFHRTLKTASDLLEMGYSRETIESLPWADDVADTQQTLARRHLSDERDVGHSSSHISLKTLWYTECYVRLDRDDDGIAELLKVALASGHDSRDAGSTLLDVEEFDHIPFVTITPIPLTHKFYGLSMADLTIDLQEIKTSLTRNILDNIYHVNNQEKVVDDEHINLDDAQESRPGGLIRADTRGGRVPLSSIVMPLQHQMLGNDVYNLMDHIDGERKSRTGVGDEVAALDPGKLANVNTGVAAIAYDSARAKVELIARNFAELGFRPLFYKLHELMRKHQDRPMTMRLRNNWVQVTPSEWRERENLRVNVGMGQASRERRMMALQSVLEKQATAAQMGGVPAIVGPQHIFAALADYTESLGLREPTRYWQDPKTYQPPPPQPDLQQQALQMQFAVEQGKLQVSQQKNQVEMLKARSQEQLALIQAQLKREEGATRARVEQLKGEMQLAKVAQESSNDRERMQGEFREKLAEREIKRAELLLEHQQEQHKRQMEQYRAELDSATKLTIEQMKQSMVEDNEQREALRNVTEGNVATLAETVRALQRQLEEADARRAEPVEVEFDDEGRVAGFSDGRRVTRDANGRPIRIG